MMDSIGQMLREAREARGLTLQEARKALRIHASYLEALEAEEFDKLPAPVYVRAFLRQYARFLGLDPEPFVEQFMTRCAPANAPRMDVGWTAVPQSEPRSFARVAWVAGLGLAVLAMGGAALLALNFQAGKEQVRRASPAQTTRATTPQATPAGQPNEASVVQPAGLPAATPAGALPAAGAQPITPAAGTAPAAGTQPGSPVGGTQPAADPATGTQPAVTPAPGTQPSAAPEAGAAQPGAQTSASPDSVPGLGIDAVLTARERCWVAIRVDGAVVFEGTLQPGETRSWKGTRVIQMRAGNAGALSLSINGQDQGPLGRVGGVVDRTFRAPTTTTAAVAVTPRP